MTTTNAADERDLDLGDDLTFTRIRPQGTGGKWVSGTIHGHHFDALVFAEHAEREEWELADSRISKLWLRRESDKQTVYNWDRGLDVPPADTMLSERSQPMTPSAEAN